MMNTVRRLAPLCLLVAPAVAHADVPEPTTAGTVVVVTPNAPVVVSGQPVAPQVAPQPQLAPPSMGLPAAEAAPPAPPQNEDWNNVSHINGQIVPVGERTAYLYAFKKTNISTNPIGWIFGFYGVSVSHAVHNNVAIRADANIMSFDHETGYELGISLPIYFRRAYSGPFIEPGIITRGFTHDVDPYCTGCTASNDTMVGPEMLFGWHWSFDSGMNVALAFGAARNLQPKDSMSYSPEIQPAGYFRVGYAF
jgi:hypothetical protein